MKAKTILTDDELIALSRRRARRRFVLIPLICAPTAIAAYWMGRSSTSGGMWMEAGLWGGALVAILLMAVILWFTREPQGGQRLPLLLRRTDELQRKRSIGLLLFALFVLLSTYPVWLGTGQIVDGTGRVNGYVMLGALQLISLLHLSNLLGLIGGKKLRPVFDDELSRHIRTQALFIGFCVLFCGAGVIFLLGVHAPRLAIQAMPLLLLYAVAATAVSYAFMDLRAGRGE